MKKYDYLVVGAGLFGSIFACEANKRGKKCLVIDKRSHVGGNVYCENIEGINVHKYGAHIFHTSNKKVWDYINSFVEFNRYTNSPVANYKGKLYNLPFNMNTFYQLWGTKTPVEAKNKIEEQKKEAKIDEPKNLEEQAISLVGNDIYEELESLAEKMVFTGMIDEFYDYKFGTLEYRSLRFENEILDEENHQGNAVVNYTEYEIPYTRIIEHKHFEYGTQKKTVITKEYPARWKKGDEPYYPINNDKNNQMYAKYKELADKEESIIFGGRLAEYKYYDMHNVIDRALLCVEEELN